MSNPNAPSQGLPPPPILLPTQSHQRQQQQSSLQLTQQPLLLQQHQVPLHHSYAPRLVSQQQQQQQQQHQQHLPSPHTLPSSSSVHFVQPHNTHQSTPQYPPSYNTASPAVLQQAADPAFFNAHPSPYSTNSVAGSYTSSEPNEAMAQATMSRQAYPPITSYHTPQSNSPASMHSPQHDASGRVYGMSSMQQPVYYGHQYSMHQPTHYASHNATSGQTHHQLPSATSMNMSYQAHQHPLHQSYPTHVQPAPHQQHSLIDSKSSQPGLQRPLQASVPLPLSSQSTPTQVAQQPPTPLQSHHPQSHQAQTQPASNVSDITLGSSTEPIQPAAPGPIPATTPQVVHQDQNGVQWIAFDYSRDRVKMQYTIRCDVESVDQDKLTDQFKTANCVYPRACEPLEKYKGNRRVYETECNTVGWALATLNVSLREKRGLIQRAVDSWRNSNRDHRLRSRRVRRQNKMEERKTRQASAAPQYTIDAHSAHPGPSMHQQLSQHASMSADGGRPMPGLPHHAMQQIHPPPDGSDPRGSVGASVDSHYQSQLPSNGLPSPSSLRHAHSFYPSYPQLQQIDTSGMNMSAAAAPLQALATPIHLSSSQHNRDAGRKRAPEDDFEDIHSGRVLHGNLPLKKRPKFVIVNDTQRGDHMRVRVKANIDSVNIDEIPDTYLTSSATYPRSCRPHQMRSPSARQRVMWNDDDDDDRMQPEQRGSTLVPVTMIDGSDGQLPVPKLSRSRRHKEVLLNQLGHRMTWAQVRTFNGRKLFLQHSLDAYRSKVHRELSGIAQKSEVATDVPTHFEVRPGRKRWLEYQDQRRKTRRS